MYNDGMCNPKEIPTSPSFSIKERKMDKEEHEKKRKRRKEVWKRGKKNMK